MLHTYFPAPVPVVSSAQPLLIQPDSSQICRPKTDLFSFTSQFCDSTTYPNQKTTKNTLTTPLSSPSRRQRLACVPPPSGPHFRSPSRLARQLVLLCAALLCCLLASTSQSAVTSENKRLGADHHLLDRPLTLDGPWCTIVDRSTHLQPSFRISTPLHEPSDGPLIGTTSREEDRPLLSFSPVEILC